MSNVSRMNSNRPGSATVRVALEDAIKKADESGHQKVLILLLDDRGEAYNTSFFNGGMYLSECIALMEYVKSDFLGLMKYG